MVADVNATAPRGAASGHRVAQGRFGEFLPHALLDQQWDEVPNGAGLESGMVFADGGVEHLDADSGELLHQAALDLSDPGLLTDPCARRHGEKDCPGDDGSSNRRLTIVREACSAGTDACTIWYMITESGVEIDAPTSLVWDVFSDVERWPEWTASVTELVALDGSGLAVGKRFQIKQPKLPKLVWEVTDVAPGVSWTWVQRSPGGATSALHSLTPIAGDRTLVRQVLDQRGPVGALIARFMIRTTRRYLEMEAQGLKARSEQLRHSLGPHS